METEEEKIWKRGKKEHYPEGMNEDNFCRKFRKNSVNSK